MTSVVQADHDFHCTFMSWGFPSEESCLCCPQATDEFREVWGQDLMDWIGATLSLPEVSKSWQPEAWHNAAETNPQEYSTLNPTDNLLPHSPVISIDDASMHYPGLEHTYVSNSLRPIAYLEGGSDPSEGCPPTFYPADNQLPCPSEDPTPLSYSKSPTSSSVDSQISSSDYGTPEGSSCTSDSAESSAESCTPRLKRKRSVYEDDLAGLDEEGEDGYIATPFNIPRPTWRRRTMTNESPSYMTGRYTPEPSTPNRRSAASPSLTKERLSPIPFKLNVHAFDEYKRSIHMCSDHAPPEPFEYSFEVSPTCFDCAHE